MPREEAEAFLQTYQMRYASGLRVNLLKISPQLLAVRTGFHLKPIPFCPSGFYYAPDEEPGKHPFHQAGLYYIQEPSAMYAAEVVHARPGERVLDLCAAPGSKSTQLAVSMGNRGLLVANEVYPKRAKVLSENIERLGITNCLVTNETPERLAHYFPGYFDKILVDAPCSGEGMFRKHPEAAQYWSEEHVAHCAHLQRQILETACRMLRAGGILVYSTCTFSPEENEQVVDWLITTHPDLELVPVDKTDGISSGRPQWSASGRQELQLTARLWPHRLAGEGHFIAKMRKKAPDRPVKTKKMPPLKASRLHDYRLFEQDTLTEKLQGVFYFQGNQLYLLPDDYPDFANLRVLRAGLHLGEQKKNRFEPNHALALALPSDRFRRRFPLRLEADEWRHYLNGATLPAPSAERGWTIVTVEGYPIGWGKSAGGTLKNNYPKGLRYKSFHHEAKGHR